VQLSTLGILQCTRCEGTLEARQTAGDDGLVEGELVCVECGAHYPVHAGIAEFACKEEVKQAYPEMEKQGRRGARLYDAFLEHFLDILKLTPAQARDEFLSHLKLRLGAWILDVGIGTGGNFARLLERRRDLELFGLDISIEMLRQAERKLAKLTKAVDLSVAFAERLPFRPNTFDAVIHVGAINEFHDPGAALTEMTRVAAPGAQIMVADEWMTDENMSKPEGQKLLKAFPSLPPRSTPPTEAVPDGAVDVALDRVWAGYGYVLRFRKPASSFVHAERGASI
jgi:ubiquinone/menaquinone biosynthesis C-methylase UbiE